MPDTSTGASIEILLFLLERIDDPHPNEWAKMVVAAKSEKAAREIANEESKAEGYIWTDYNLANARMLGVAADGVSGVVMVAKE